MNKQNDQVVGSFIDTESNMYEDSYRTMRINEEEIETKDDQNFVQEEYPFTFKDFKTNIPLNEQQVDMVSNIMQQMHKTGETGRFDIN